MKYAHPALTGALALCALILALVVLDKPNDPGSSPDRTVYSFAYNAKRQNFGKACSWMTDQWRSYLDVCARHEVKVIPGSRVDIDDNTVVYDVDFGDGYAPSKVRVVRTADGLWRIDEVV